MMSEENKRGRPPLRDVSQKRDQKVMLTFTKEEYQNLKKMQVLLNKATLTSTIHDFIDRGMKDLKQELVQTL
jgi:hypothetical protein